MNQWLAQTPFDLYQLALFNLVAKHRNFTKAAEVAGLTQSAMTRQIQGMEGSIGVELVKRTTRTVSLTPAGEFLLRESVRLLGDAERSHRWLLEKFAGARKEIRVDVSKTISPAYLPGFFHANLRHAKEVGYRISYESSNDILLALEADEQDVGVLCPPRRLPRTLRITHRFDDQFTAIAPRALSSEFMALPNTKKRKDWLNAQNWLLIDNRSNTGRQLRSWIQKQGLKIAPTVELDNFDLIINLVGLGMGLSFVPRRALSLYGQKRTFQRLTLPENFRREVVVLARRHRKLPDHLVSFFSNILF